MKSLKLWSNQVLEILFLNRPFFTVYLKSRKMNRLNPVMAKDLLW